MTHVPCHQCKLKSDTTTTLVLALKSFVMLVQSYSFQINSTRSMQKVIIMRLNTIHCSLLKAHRLNKSHALQ